MTYDKLIFDKANELIQTYCTRDPFEIAQGLGVKIIPIKYTGDFIGNYFICEGKPFIAINSNLNDEILKIIIAHEIEHFIFDEPVELSNYGNYGNKYQILIDENHAELFVACLLLDGEDIYDYIYIHRFTFSQISRIMHIDEKYIKLRYEIMTKFEFEKFRNIF